MKYWENAFSFQPFKNCHHALLKNLVLRYLHKIVDNGEAIYK